jgi:16S rRNA G966 N2-methylase RsmD
MPKDADKKILVFNKEAMATIKILYGKNKKFDIILLDPPYYKGWIKKCLKYLNIYDILAPSGVILAEHFKKDEMPQQLAGLKLIRQLTYGDTIISIFKRT